MKLLTAQEIRASRIGFDTERFNDTAKRMGCHAADVHRAMSYESLTQAERDEIIASFLSADRVGDIANRLGTSQTAVLTTVRGALIHARVEAAMKVAA
ncbi:hypothetical protein CI15_18995 [Paraburkholderia monticola]|uniref:Uncharacterized protein n=1 Tax=Paraburkholderia monticola TaxID=1399968 RepID=A0A149PN85_9BURK|nr:hypothetical protein [Paraburkholderia monticola]KXU86525.1 hypothetical protein CI15_18995 [Paraburkholderia monticola]